jgi:hypothetical protein
MKLHLILAAVWLAASMAVSGQTLTQPGIPAATQVISESGSFVPTAITPSQSYSSSSIATEESQHDRTMKHVWIASVAAMFAGTSMDAATSWGRHEGNGLLAQSNGTFGAKGVGIKVGVAAVSFVPELILRKHKELRTPFIIGNFAEAGIFTGTAMHNLTVK